MARSELMSVRSWTRAVAVIKPIGRIGRKRRRQLLRFDRHIDREGQHLELRRAGRLPQPQRPWSEALPDDDMPVGQVPCGFFQ